MRIDGSQQRYRVGIVYVCRRFKRETCWPCFYIQVGKGKKAMVAKAGVSKHQKGQQSDGGDTILYTLAAPGPER